MEDPASPVHNTILGVPVVTIPLADYADLLDYKRQVSSAFWKGMLDETGQAGLFTRDPEVAVFAATRFGILTAGEIVDEIGRIFGEERRPLVLTIHRFWMRMRPFLPPHVQEMAI